MYHGGGAIYTNNDWKFSAVNVYTNNSWERAIPYVYTNGHWQIAGGAGVNLVYLLTKNSAEYVLDSTNGNILVREK